MRRFFTLFLLAIVSAQVLVQPQAHAQDGLTVGEVIDNGNAELVIQEIRRCDHADGAHPSLNLEFRTRFLPLGGLRCELKERLEAGLDAASIALGAGTLLSACTGVGTPVTITFSILGLASQTVKAKLDRMTCDDSANDEKIRMQIHRTVCEALTQRGFRCDPDHL